MTHFDRRQFLRGSAAALALAAAGRSISRLWANPLGLPIGLQLYTVREQIAKDLKGTLAQVAAIGYKEVEIDGFYHLKPVELRKTLEEAGLTAPSGHCGAEQLKTDPTELIDSYREAGAQYLVCSFPAHRPGTAQPMVRVAGQPFVPNFDAEDYKWMAEVFNKTGEQCQQAGMQFGYHNHNLDFKTFDGETALDQLMHNTDSKLVQLELDCYWVSRAGKDPVDYMKRYAGRVPLLHIKDMKSGLTPTTDIVKGGDHGFTEAGRGCVDWKRIFGAAPEAGVKHYFVEQDTCDGPPIESAKISFEYLKNLQV
ncbi:MAG TPA: sugar phosphate isomerase/epimerase [Terriglobia bacterium]|nr:sugar phosphate isomerase/epimerase [Terriglobia bacterium]